MEYLISIDGSTSATGLAVFTIKKDRTLSYKKHYLFRADKHKYTKKTKDMKAAKYKEIHTAEKIAFMEKDIEFMADNIIRVINSKYKPSKVVMEDTYGGNDFYTLKYLSRLQGCVKGICLEHGITVEFKASSSWRKSLGFKTYKKKRPELKAMAVDYVKKLLGMDVTDDEADAICLGLSSTP